MRIAIAAAVACLSIVGVTATAQVHAAIRKHTEIPAEPLDLALRTLAKDRGFQVVYLTEDVRALQTRGAIGDFTVDEALKRLLSDSRLDYKFVDENTVSIFPKTNSSTALEDKDRASASVRNEGSSVDSPKSSSEQRLRLAQVDQGQTSGPAPVNNQDAQDSKKKSDLEEIVVTGTSIRGVVPAGSPLTIYSRDDIDQSGAGTLDQFARDMTENFGDVDTVSNNRSNTTYGKFSSSDTNTFAGASFDLHGVGPSATLTLLNGQRFAAAGEDGSLSDISMIPMSAVDHIEVLDDGASAIYGADAVAGVVNIVTRKHFDGAETGIRYGDATEGGDREETAWQLLGHTWLSGDILFDYEYDDQEGLDASQRDYIPPLGGADSLIPANRRNTAFISGNQEFATNTTISWNGIYSKRDFTQLGAENSPGLSLTSSINNSGFVELYGGWVTLDQALFRDWHGTLTGNYSRADQSWTENQFEQEGTKQTTYNEFKQVPTNTLEFDAAANGTVLSLPGGAAKVAVGTSYRREEFSESYAFVDNGTSVPEGQVPSLQRHIASVYGEVFLPIIEKGNAMPGAERLEISASGRYDHYSDVGSTTNPKVGLVWEFVPGIDLRGSYGTAFRAPYLSQLGAAVTSETIPAPDPTSRTGLTDMLLVEGGNPNLKPETSRAFTAGLDLSPPWLPNFKFTTTYFDISFKNRIATPPVFGSGFLTNPELAPVITRNPPLSLVESYFNSPGFQGDYATYGGFAGGPGDVTALFNNGYSNIASTTTTGIEFAGTYGIPTDYGLFKLSAAADVFLEYEYQPTSTTPAFELVNTYAEPTKWKAHSAVSWTRGQFAAAVAVNYVGAYQNTTFTPALPISSWTTSDLHFSYNTGEGPTSDILRGITLSLGILNFTDRHPPYAPLAPTYLEPGQPSIPYDAANASPVGRLIAITLKKRW